MNDTEYLQRQAADARAAMGGTGRWVMNRMEEDLSPRRLIKRAEAHLWTWAAAIAAAGIAGATLFGKRMVGGGKYEAPKSETPHAEPISENKSDRRVQVERIVPIVTELLALARPVISAVGAVAAARADKKKRQQPVEPVQPPRRRRPRKSS